MFRHATTTHRIHNPRGEVGRTEAIFRPIERSQIIHPGTQLCRIHEIAVSTASFAAHCVGEQALHTSWIERGHCTKAISTEWRGTAQTVARCTRSHGIFAHLPSEASQHESQCECVSFCGAFRQEMGEFGDLKRDYVCWQLGREENGDFEQEHGSKAALDHGLVNGVLDIGPIGESFSGRPSFH